MSFLGLCCQVDIAQVGPAQIDVNEVTFSTSFCPKLHRFDKVWPGSIIHVAPAK